MEQFFIRAYAENARGGKAGEPMRFTASTEDVARDGLIIEASAWQLDNYRRNPVFLWAHDYFGQRPPIGRVDAFSEETRLVADVLFDQGDAFAREIERKYHEGFLSAVSVGWRTLEFAPAENPKVYGIVKRADLLDISAVPVPSDPKALKEREARALKDLRNEFDKLIQDGAADAPARGEFDLSWEAAAYQMVRLLLAAPQIATESDAARKLWLGQYRQIEKQYRKLGKTTPEVVSVDFKALDANALRGLLLENEGELFAELFDLRAGAVLSARNRGDLENAVTLIQGVLKRAKKEEESADDEASPRGEALTHLREVMDTLNKIAM